MQPFLVAESLMRVYRRYVEAGFPLRDGPLKRELDRLIREEHLLWRGPYISLACAFIRVPGVPALVKEGRLLPEMAALFGHLEQLWHHQATALDQIGCGVNTIVATGTGSGKTEAFLLPIVDYCLRHRHESGIKAVLIYPMNALINDQLKRLRELLGGKGLITFGRYTGETPAHVEKHPSEAPAEERFSRSEIRQNPPDILLTNYTMLEYLLLRKKDQEIFQGRKPRFLVLDEVHTYTGILGAEVACLIRRLKAHCQIGEDELVCIGTSATVKGGGEEAKARADLTDFAGNLFGEWFSPDAIITEAVERLSAPSGRTHPAPLLREVDLEGLDLTRPDAIRKLARLVLCSDLGSDPARQLWELIRENPLFREMEHWLEGPTALDTLIARLAEYREVVPAHREQVRLEAIALLLLGSAAIGPGGEPRFKPKVHLFVRGLHSLLACTHADCERTYLDGQTTCNARAHAGERQTLPVAVCRSCGADYRMAYVPRSACEMLKARAKEGRPDIRRQGSLSLEPAVPEGEASYPLFLYPGAESDFLTAGEQQRITTAPYGLCSRCLTIHPLNKGMSYCPQIECEREPLRPVQAFFGAGVCPVCGAQGHGTRPEIITTLRSAVAPSVSVLTSALFPHIGNPAAADDEGKLLIFSDSRQDTAHQAGYIRDRQQLFAERQVVYQAIREYEATRTGHVVLAELAREAYRWAEERFGDVTAYTLLTPIDIYPEDEHGIIAPLEKITNYYRNRTIDRLAWDLALEFTQKGQQRYALERLGLVAVAYSGLKEAVRRTPPDFGSFGCRDAHQAEAVLRTILDYARYQQALLYTPFRTYLAYNHPLVRAKLVRPDKYNRQPVGVRLEKEEGKTHRIVGLLSSDTERYDSSLTAAIRKVLPHLHRPAAAQMVESAFEWLVREHYLVQTELDPGTAAKRTAYMVDSRLAELVAGGPRYQCPSCRRVQGYRLTTPGGEAVCSSWRCTGNPEPYTPDPDSFYVATYQESAPQNILAYEHSGQLSGKEREIIEQKFKEGPINTLVCTPTLEMGIDLGDLEALIMRNVPPTPSNYAQRSGRAGRRRRISLAITYAGPGPHDAYFYSQPPEMIRGTITPPSFDLDNQVVIERHIRSLIVELLPSGIPNTWAEIADEQGNITGLPVILEGFTEQRGAVVQAVQAAFVRDRRAGGLAWLDASAISSRVDAFPHELKQALQLWSVRFKEIDAQLVRLRQKALRGNEADERDFRRVKFLRDEMWEGDEYRPLAFLAEVGFLPRYGFPGNLISIEDPSGRQVTQAASVGITEYAPGNIVYVAGQKLQVQQVRFRDGQAENPALRLKTYQYCSRCSFAIYGDGFFDYCELCEGHLTRGVYIDYTSGFARRDDWITAEEDVRDREAYDLVHYLALNEAESSVPVSLGEFTFTYSKRALIHLVNRCLRQAGENEPFLICAKCGAWKNSAYTESKHLEWCTVGGWDPALYAEVAPVHLHTSFHGDVLQVAVPDRLVANQELLLTLKSALIFGAARYLGAQSGEIEGFERKWKDPDGNRHVELVLYDTMPGGTGYLKRLQAHLPEALEAVGRLLDECDCTRACYRCLLDYRNQRDHRAIDKGLIRDLLAAAVANAANAVAAVASPTAKGTGPTGDSPLETAFLHLLLAQKLPLPDQQENLLDRRGGYIIRADFTYPAHRLVILTDGAQFHQADTERLLKDVTQRNALEKEGRKLLEFSYGHVTREKEYTAGMVARALGLQGSHPAASKVSLPPLLTYQPDPNADVHLAQVLSSREERRALQRFLDELENRAPGISLGGELTGEGGYRLPLLASLPTQQIALLLYREQQESEDVAAWVTGLRSVSIARLLGWRLYRVPLGWMGNDRQEEILSLLS